MEYDFCSKVVNDLINDISRLKKKYVIKHKSANELLKSQKGKTKAEAKSLCSKAMKKFNESKSIHRTLCNLERLLIINKDILDSLEKPCFYERIEDDDSIPVGVVSKMEGEDTNALSSKLITKY